MPKSEQKKIWLIEPNLDQLNSFNKNTIVEHIGIKIIECGDDYLVGTMPVDHRTVQGFGIVHGGSYVVLAETLGSMASSMVIEFPKFKAVGLDINSNHIRSAKEGIVKGIAKPIHLGRRTHVWQIKIFSEQEKLLNISRLTMAIIE